MNYPKQTMLKVLRGLKQIRIVKSAQVAIQCPDDVVRTPKDIIEGLNVYYATKANQGKIGMSNPYMPTEMMQTAPVQALPTAIDNQPVNDSEIKEIKEEMTQIKETVGALTTSISELVKALSESKKG